MFSAGSIKRSLKPTVTSTEGIGNMKRRRPEELQLFATTLTSQEVELCIASGGDTTWTLHTADSVLYVQPNPIVAERVAILCSRSTACLPTGFGPRTIEACHRIA